MHEEYYRAAADVLLATLRAHRGLDERFVEKFFLRSLPHMVIGYLLLLAAVITFIVFLFAVCQKCCSKSHSKTRCCELCFFFEGLLFVIASAILLFGVVAQLQIAARLDTALHTLPAQATTTLVALETLRANLYRRIEELRGNHSQTLKFTLRSVADLPTEMTKLATEVMGTMASRSQELSSEIRRHLQADTNATGVMLNAGTVILTATAVTDRVHKELAALARQVQNDTHLLSKSRLALASAIDAARETAQVALLVPGLPDWVSESATMSVILDTFLPAVETSADFKQHAPATLLAHLESLMLSSLRLAAYEASVAVNKTANNVAAASEALLPTRWIDELTSRLQTWQKVVASLDVGSYHDGSTVFSGRALLVLVPGVHGIVTLIVAAAAAAVSVVEMRRHSAAHSPLFLRSGRSLGARLLWASAMFGASLLWLHLLLAGGGQLLSYVGSTACRPVLDLRIFRDLLDNTEVWDGMTYMDTKLAGLVSRDNKPNGTRMLDLLDNCHRRQNLLAALGIDLGPALSKELEQVSLIVNASQLECALDKGLLVVEWMSVNQVDSMQTLLQKTYDSINLTIIAQVTSRAANLTAANLTRRHLWPLLLALPRDPSYDYIQEVVRGVIDDITLLETALLPNLRTALEKLAELPRVLAKSMRSLHSLSSIARGLSQLLHSEVRAQTQTLAQACAAEANQRMRDWRRSVAPAVSSELGSCRAVFDAYVTVAQGVCGEGLSLANAIWVTHLLMAIALMAMMLLSCHLGVCLRGVRVRYLRMRLHLHRKISEQSMQAALGATSTHELEMKM